MIRYIDIVFGTETITCGVDITPPERESGVIKIPTVIDIVSVYNGGCNLTRVLNGLDDLIGNNLVWNKIDELIAEQL